MATKHAATKVDWQKLLTVVSSINSTTAAQLSAFKKRHDELRRTTKALEDSIPEIDFEYYRRVLKNQDVVKRAESALADFKPVKMALDDQLAVISKFEKKAIEKAEETAKQVEAEVNDLKQTIKNIETARPVDQLTYFIMEHHSNLDLFSTTIYPAVSHAPQVISADE
ncbi:MAG: ATP synthase D chain, mitochondrial [Olpidium bornovanus]|uniref:ATP synthase subunit d, mitochondrial n=1 Tax=Olpidium bornovanus TaxID=278681 RepID=A0A8H7ZTT2_9FUNG|nr:MAG: ATP synthase D chain, mitochondrial [Olpidium bornovanus]